MAKRHKRKREWSKATPSAGVQSKGSSRLDFLTLHGKQVLQAVVITAAVLWIYWPALHGGWLWDDDVDITNNSITQSPTGLWNIWFEPGSQFDYYPIKASVQWVQWHIWGMDTLGYHLTNVLLHILSALLVWRLLSKFGLRLAWLGGLIFAVHPVQVESVAWIAELKNSLSLPPFLLAMCAWIDFDERGKVRHYFVALGLFLVAMLCKTTMVMFPVVILLHAWWKRGRIGWNDVKLSMPFFVVSMALGLITVWCQQHTAMEQNDASLGGFFSRLACAGLSLSFYFSKCFLPLDLMPIYPKWPIDPPSVAQFLPWPVLGGVIYWLWTKRQSWGRHALLGSGFFLIFLAPFLGFKAISYMSFSWVMNHFLYIPIIGLIGLAVAALGQMKNQLSTSLRPYSFGVAAMLLALLAFGSREYAALYINSETLWTYALKQNPEATLARNDLGDTLLQNGRVSEAIEQFEQALQIEPEDSKMHNNLGSALTEMGRFSEAIEQFEQALRINPDYVGAHNNLGLALVRSGRMSDAVEQYQEALRIKPDNAVVRNNLGSALNKLGRSSDAIEQFELALRINPGYVKAHNNLGYVLVQLGRLPEAVEQFEESLQINPNDAVTHYNLGYALQREGHAPEAMEEYEQALYLKPDLTVAQNDLAKLQALQKTIPKNSPPSN